MPKVVKMQPFQTGTIDRRHPEARSESRPPERRSFRTDKHIGRVRVLKKVRSEHLLKEWRQCQGPPRRICLRALLVPDTPSNIFENAYDSQTEAIDINVPMAETYNFAPPQTEVGGQIDHHSIAHVHTGDEVLDLRLVDKPNLAILRTWKLDSTAWVLTD